jgi:hypothetical protein
LRKELSFELFGFEEISRLSEKLTPRPTEVGVPGEAPA